MVIFMSTIDDFSKLVLVKEDYIFIDIFYSKNDFSSKLMPRLNFLLKNADAELASINELYFLDLPGSQTGYQVSLIFARILKVLKPKMNFFILSSRIWDNNLYEKMNFTKKNSQYFFQEISKICNILPVKISFLKLQNKVSLPIHLNEGVKQFVENFFFLKDKFQKKEF